MAWRRFPARADSGGLLDDNGVFRTESTAAACHYRGGALSALKKLKILTAFQATKADSCVENRIASLRSSSSASACLFTASWLLVLQAAFFFLKRLLLLFFFLKRLFFHTSVLR